MSNEPTNSSLDLDLLAWFEVNKKAVYGGLVLIFVVAAAVIVWRYREEAAHRKAGEALVLAQLAAGPSATSIGVDRLNAIATEHAGTPTARQARLLAAQELFTSGRHADARTAFSALAEGPADEVGAIAQLGVAASHEAEGNIDAALTAYQQVAGLPAPQDFVAPQARLSRGRLLESAGRHREALAEYEALTKEAG